VALKFQANSDKTAKNLGGLTHPVFWQKKTKALDPHVAFEERLAVL